MKTASYESIVEDSPLTPFLKRLALYTSGGTFLDGYILVIIGIALMQLGRQLKLDAFWEGLIGAAALVGMFLGAVVFGYVTDLLGRRLMYQIEPIVIIVLSVAQMFVTTAWELALLRFLIGIVVGADYPIATSLLTEFSPRKYRGLMLGFLICVWYLGGVGAAVVGYALLSVGPDGWKWMLGSAAVPALLLVFGRWNTPESPRWLVNKGRLEEAQEVLWTVWGTHADFSDVRESPRQRTDFLKVFRPGYLGRTIFIGTFQTVKTIPVFAIYTFGPQILEAFHLGGGNLWIIAYALTNAFFLIGCIPPLMLIDSLGRRPLMIWSFLFMTLGLLVLGLFPHAPAWVIISGLLVYALVSGGPGVLQWIYPNELFPTEVRATAVGVATAVSRIGAGIGTFALPYWLQIYGIGTTMLINAGITMLGFVVSVWLAPETKGLSLREGSELGANPALVAGVGNQQ
jgi:putative MFS transporter